MTIRPTLTIEEAHALLHIAHGAMDDFGSDDQADEESIATLAHAITQLRSAIRRNQPQRHVNEPARDVGIYGNTVIAE